MARKETPLPTGTPEMAALAHVTQAPLDAAHQVMTEAEARTFELARSLGYDGALTVGGLEDEIRFYQRQTVESMLQVGKRLLVLRTLCQIGTEFDARVELLGFARRTAYRFMQASSKTAKSVSVAALADRVKNTSTFLELITHDDDVVKELGELDAFDKMSASQLRDAARQLEQDKNGFEKVNADLHQKMDALKAKHAGKKVVAATDWPAAFTVLMDQAAGAGKDLHKALDGLKAVLQVAIQVEPASEHEEASLIRAHESLAEVMQSILSKGIKRSAELALLFDQTIAPSTTAGQVEQPA